MRWWLWTSLVAGVEWQAATIKGFYNFADFIPLGEPDAQVMLIVESFQNPAKLVVMDISQDTFSSTPLFSTSGVCKTKEPLELDAYQFLPLNSTSCVLHCAYIPGGGPITSALFLLTWNAKFNNLTVDPYYGYYDDQGWLFTLPAPSYTYPPANGQATVALTTNADSAVYADIDVINTSSWGKVLHDRIYPGFAFGSSLILNESTAIVGQGYPSVLSFLDLKTSKIVAKLTAAPDVGYAVCGTTPSSALVILNDGKAHLWMTIQRLEDAPKGPALNISFPRWTIYPGDFGRNAAGFSPDEKTVFIIFEADPGPVKMFMIGIDSSPPKLLGTVDVNYEYTHNVVVSNSWVYVDTDSNVLSRFRYTR